MLCDIYASLKYILYDFFLWHYLESRQMKTNGNSDLSLQFSHGIFFFLA